MRLTGGDTCEFTANSITVAGDTSVRSDHAIGEATGRSEFGMTGAGSGDASAFDLPPEYEDHMLGIHHSHTASFEDEDVFGHGDDLGLPAYCCELDASIWHKMLNQVDDLTRYFVSASLSDLGSGSRHNPQALEFSFL